MGQVDADNTVAIPVLENGHPTVANTTLKSPPEVITTYTFPKNPRSPADFILAILADMFSG